MQTSISNNKLLIVWQDNKNRSEHVIGELIKSNGFQFRYFVDKVKALREKGFDCLVAFSDIEKTYTSTYLFPSFALRLPDKRRKDISKILDFYNLETYDEFELLRKSGGKLQIDLIKFIDPIDLSCDYIERDFYIAGTGCCINDEDIDSFQKNDTLQCNLDTGNDFDKGAVQILHDYKLIGFIPIYFSEKVAKAIELGRNIEARIMDTEQIDRNSKRLVQIKLVIT